MNTLKKTIAAAALASAGVTAQAEISGSVSVASAYLWRGQNLSEGSAAVSGSLDYAHESGAYAGIWTTSGSDAYGSGQEYDLYAGWAGSFDDFGVDLSYWDYNYPVNTSADLEEFVLGLSYMDFSFNYYQGLGDADDASYMSVSAPLEDFTFTYGYMDLSNDATGSHFDVSYAYTDNMSFTTSYSFDDGAGYSEELQFVVSYSIPLEM